MFMLDMQVLFGSNLCDVVGVAGDLEQRDPIQGNC